MARSTVSSASGSFLGEVEQRLVGFCVHDDGQQAVLEGIVAENIGERGADDGPEAEAGQRPGSVLAG